MEPIQLYDLAARKSAWLAARQSVLAANVANAETPGYRARDVAPFADVLAKTQLQMASTSAGHLPISGSGDAGGAATIEQTSAFDTAESGNSVGLETEMMKAGEVNRDYALTSNVLKSFHAMLMASLKG